MTEVPFWATGGLGYLARAAAESLAEKAFLTAVLQPFRHVSAKFPLLAHADHGADANQILVIFSGPGDAGKALWAMLILRA
jgi:hypothetical protein